MLNLKLFTSLQGQNTASLLLRPGAPGMVQYFLMASSVNYNIVVSGECDGELSNSAPISFDLMLSSITPLLDRKHNFRISYTGGVLKFIEINDKFFVEPLCVEHISDVVVQISQRYLDSVALLDKLQSATEQRKTLEDQLLYNENNYRQLKIMDLSGGPSANPWGDPRDLDNTSVDKTYKPKIEELKKKIAVLDETLDRVHELDLSYLKRLAAIAARYNTTVAMCDDFAVVELKNSYVLQKCKCGVRAIQGKLLQRLLAEETGQFYEADGEIFFHSTAGKGKARSDTMVFLHPYLPSTLVNSSIVTKGIVKEKYTLNLKGMLAVASAVSSKFETMVFDMGSQRLVLSNDRGEHLVHKFDVEDARTIELGMTLRGEYSGPIPMASIEIPKEVQTIIGYLRDNFTIYVKDKKIVLQSESLYVIFAR